jgi:4-amino-4-deoxy-L-arabinose transferase-like glycosyltransferase
MSTTSLVAAGPGFPHRGRISSYSGPVALGLILALAALLRAWHLDQSGFGTQYYAAGVLSMLGSWHNFWFNSFDPVGFVSIDKPPLALWAQVASAKAFGFSSWSIHLPQVLEGVAAVALLYYLVRRRFGRGAGLLAALFLAITPISVAIDRSNNTDSCLVLGLLAAAWALSLASESGSRRMLFLSMVLIGIAFNVKMLAAIVVVPAFMATYLLGAPLPTSRKFAHLLLAAVVLTVVSLLWCVSYDLTPAPARPYAGSTKTNSMLELVVGENGVRRFVRMQRFNRPNAGLPPGASTTSGAPAAGVSNNPSARNATGAPGFGPRAADGVPVGPLRLANPLLADQMGWLYPLAAMGLVVSLWRRRIRLPLDSADSALWLWAGWTVIYGVVLSCAGGVFHAYYLAAMAPPVCALAAIGLVRLWRWHNHGGRRALALPVTVIAVVAWQVYIGHGYLALQLSNPLRTATAPAQSLNQLQHVLIAATLLVTALTVALLWLAHAVEPLRSRAWSRAAATAAVVAILLTPAAWAVGSMQSSLNANSPAAQLPDIGDQRGQLGLRRGRGDGSADQRLVAYLTNHYHDERFLLATLSAVQAAPLIIATGKPVMAMGGFMGSDPILTPESFSRMVQQKQLRFVLIGPAGGPGFANRGSGAQAALVQWVQDHGTPVDPSLWRTPPQTRREGTAAAPSNRRNARNRGFNGDAASQLFDLEPEAQPGGETEEEPALSPEYDTPEVLARLSGPAH